LNASATAALLVDAALPARRSAEIVIALIVRGAERDDEHLHRPRSAPAATGCELCAVP
jgi:hypothetical protein